MKKIQVSFVVPTKDLKGYESVKLPVSMNIPDNNEVYGNIEYSVVLPDYIFNELADTEPQFKTTYDVNNSNVSGCFAERTITRKFKKTQTAILISTLQNYFNELTNFINDKHSIETSTMKKKIFIYFNHKQRHTTNGLNGAYTGEEISQTFKYFTGYEVMTDKFSGIKRTVSKKYVSKIFYSAPGSSLQKLDTGFKEKDDIFLPLNGYNESIEQFESKYSIIDWTPDREDFCKKIQQKFVDVNTNLESFLLNIDNVKFELMMSDLKMLNS